LGHAGTTTSKTGKLPSDCHYSSNWSDNCSWLNRGYAVNFQFDVFLSHSSADNDLVVGMTEQLRDGQGFGDDVSRKGRDFDYYDDREYMVLGDALGISRRSDDRAYCEAVRSAVVDATKPHIPKFCEIPDKTVWQQLVFNGNSPSSIADRWKETTAPALEALTSTGSIRTRFRNYVVPATGSHL